MAKVVDYGHIDYHGIGSFIFHFAAELEVRDTATAVEELYQIKCICEEIIFELISHPLNTKEILNKINKIEYKSEKPKAHNN